MKRIAKILGIVVVVLIVVVISLPFLINANQFRPMLESKLSQGLGREVKLGDLKFSFLSGGVTASDLASADHPESTSIDDLKLIAPAIGGLTGAGVISASHALDFKMRVTLHTSGVVMAAMGQRGDTTVPFMIQGTSSNPSFKPDMKSIASAELKSLTVGELKKLGGNNAEKAVGLVQGLLNGKQKQ